jgi:hypothetical protein
MSRPSHSTQFDHPDSNKLVTTLRNFLQFPVTSFILGPNILLSTLFTNTLNLREI